MFSIRSPWVRAFLAKLGVTAIEYDSWPEDGAWRMWGVYEHRRVVVDHNWLDGGTCFSLVTPNAFPKGEHYWGEPFNTSLVCIAQTSWDYPEVDRWARADGSETAEPEDWRKELVRFILWVETYNHFPGALAESDWGDVCSGIPQDFESNRYVPSDYDEYDDIPF